jgi:hypothetical protein
MVNNLYSIGLLNVLSRWLFQLYAWPGYCSGLYGEFIPSVDMSAGCLLIFLLWVYNINLIVLIKFV